jgi:hypothetical protein
MYDVVAPFFFYNDGGWKSVEKAGTLTRIKKKEKREKKKP